MRTRKGRGFLSFLTLAVIGLVWCAGGCVNSSKVTMRLIEVRDMRGRPVAEARVFVRGEGVNLNGTTGDDGTFRISHIGPSLSLVVERKGYQSQQTHARENENPVKIVLKEEY